MTASTRPAPKTLRWSSPLRRLGAAISAKARWAPPAAAYVVPTVVSVVAVQFWFRGHTVLATGDLVPPVTPGDEYRAHWNQFDNGAGTPSYAIVWLPYFEGLRLFSWLGLSDAGFQRLWLSVAFAGATAATVFLARALVRSPLAAAVAGVLATFNAYRLTVGFDAVPLVATIAAALLGGLILRAGRGDRQANPVFFAFASLSLGFVFVNPAHVYLVALWLAASLLLTWAAFGRDGLRRAGVFLMRAAPIAVLLNLWWIVPAVLTLTGPVFGEQFSAPGIAGWTWTHTRNTIPNILGMTSFWAWSHPEYYPFAARLGRAPFNVLQYTLAVAAALGLLLAGRREQRLAFALAGTGVVTIWILKGVQAPLPGTNRWAYDHLPGFWLLRDPAKARLILVLVFALLGALAIDTLIRSRPPLGVVLGAVLMAGALTYGYPLLTGAVVPDRRPLLPSAHVTVPGYWSRAASYMSSAPADGKVVVLPQLDYYQVPTTWGYYGGSFSHALIHRPVVEPLPGGYFSSPVVLDLVRTLQHEILRGGGNVTALLQALGVRYVLLRRDLDRGFPGRAFVAPEQLRRALGHVAGLHHSRTFGRLDVYEAVGLGGGEIYPAAPLRGWAASAASLYRNAAIGEGAAVTTPHRAKLLAGVETGTARLVAAGRGPLAVTASPEERGLVMRITSRNGRKRLVFPKLRPPLRVFAGTVSVRVSGLKHPVSIGIPKTFPRVYALSRSRTGSSIPLGPLGAETVGDCHRYDRRSARQLRLSARVVRRGGRATIRLAARSHSACLAIPIAGFPQGPLLVRLAYRGISGLAPRLCVWEDGPDRCATLTPLEPSSGWRPFEATLRPDPGTRSLRLFLYADGNGQTLTVTEYRDVKVTRARGTIAVGAVPTRLPTLSSRRVAPFEFRVRVRNSTGPFMLVLAETYAPGWRLKAGSRTTAGVAHVRANGYANAWRVPWRGTYELTLTYAPERLSRLAGRADLALVPISLLLLLVVRLRRTRTEPPVPR